MPASIPSHRGKKTWSVHACGAGIVLMVVVCFQQGIYAPWQRDAEARVARIDQLHRLLSTGDTVAQKHRKLSNRLAALTLAADNVHRRMPTLASPSKFIEQLTQTAASMGLEVQQCGASSPETFPDHTRVEVTCKLSGSYASICRCLAAVDQFSQMSKVTRLEVATAPDSLSYPAQITFQLYYRHQRHDKEVKRGAS
jgi:Tfp pilus assembly protein PilO